MQMLPQNRTKPHYTSGLFPHSVVAGTSAPQDDGKAYRLAHAAYLMIVSFETVIGLILRPEPIWHLMKDGLRTSFKSRRIWSEK